MAIFFHFFSIFFESDDLHWDAGVLASDSTWINNSSSLIIVPCNYRISSPSFFVYREMPRKYSILLNSSLTGAIPGYHLGRDAKLAASPAPRPPNALYFRTLQRCRICFRDANCIAYNWSSRFGSLLNWQLFDHQLWGCRRWKMSGEANERTGIL